MRNPILSTLLLLAAPLALPAVGNSAEQSPKPARKYSDARSVAYLGALIQPTGNGGVMLTEVLDNSPALHARLQANDVIHAVNGQAVATPGEFHAAIDRAGPGAQVTLTLRRAKEQKETQVRLGTMPDLAGTPVYSRWPLPEAVRDAILRLPPENP